MTEVVVVGGGVAGCAAAVSAAIAGARVVLIERQRFLGGVAASGEHRTLCGLAPIDAPTPTLLEPDLVEDWLPQLSTGAPMRQGRVWLWPTRSDVLQRGLAARLGDAGVEVRLGTAVGRLEMAGERIVAVHGPGVAWPVGSVIDASGSGVIARLAGVACAAARQWPSYRAVLALDLDPGPATRVRALTQARDASGSDAAIALTPIAEGRWQLSLDVPPATRSSDAAAIVDRVATVLGAEVVAMAIAVAQRDDGRPAGALTLAQLFAQRDRGLCWAAWPREAHAADGIAWTWPEGDRHGVPISAATIADGPPDTWFIGKGMPVADDAAAALRVTGTCLAVGSAVGRLAARDRSRAGA